MSRKTIYHDERFSLVGGQDHALGVFLQLFDKEMEDETPEGEGLVLDWSELFGIEINFTGISISDHKNPPIDIAIQYIEERREKE
jgi:hypothetical protein